MKEPTCSGNRFQGTKAGACAKDEPAAGRLVGDVFMSISEIEHRAPPGHNHDRSLTPFAAIGRSWSGGQTAAMSI
jgi:hypothetical protein